MTTLNMETDWHKIRKHFNKSFRSNFYVSVASVDADGCPTVTPIGSLFLNPDLRGFYFEKFPSKLLRHAGQNKKVCLLGVNSNRWFCIRSLWRGKFTGYPAVKLYGELGPRRKATESEAERLQRRMKLTKGWKGHTYLWKDMECVREIRFTKAEKINLGKMTASL